MPSKGEKLQIFETELDIPSSINERLRGSRFKSRKLKNWEQHSGWKVKTSTTEKTTEEVNVFIMANINRRRDIDNIIKPILDILQYGPIKNDNQVHQVTARRASPADKLDKNRARIVVFRTRDKI